VTLCEAYLGIDPEFDLWKHFFHVRRPQDLEAELMICVVRLSMSSWGHGVDPYLEIPMPRSMKRWQKKWFYLRNDASALLPSFTSGYPIPLSTQGDGVAMKDLGRLQPMCKALQQL
jgi:hypothetical protein